VSEEAIAPAPSDPVGMTTPIAPAGADAVRRPWRLRVAVLVVLLALTVASLALAWRADQRGAALEQELVRRQQDSAVASNEARALAKQAQETVGQTAAKVALLEARVAEVAVQRSQLEDLIQSLSRSRDENLLVDVEAAIRVAMRQSTITGSAEPLVATLKQSDERMARYNQPRLEGVRRAIARDLDRVKAASVVDLSSLAIKLDEAIRMADELPLSAGFEPGRAPIKPPAPAKPASGPPSTRLPVYSTHPVQDGWDAMTQQIWASVQSLFRVTRIEHPEAMLLAPDQSFFVRENLKLRLLNARLALLSRQFETAQSDLQVALATIDRYFEHGAKRTMLATDLLRQVESQARQVGIPKPDDTFAALAAATAGR
jgi:uroporphyrin-3 C-methyltransferase